MYYSYLARTYTCVQLHLFASSFPLCLKQWYISQPAHLSSRPTGVPTTQRRPITAQTFTPSLCGQLVKNFCVQAFFFFSLCLFFLLPFMEPLESGADGKIVTAGTQVSGRERENWKKSCIDWGSPATMLDELNHKVCLQLWLNSRETKQSDRTTLRGDIDSSSQLWRAKTSQGPGEQKKQKESEARRGVLQMSVKAVRQKEMLRGTR